MRFFCCRLRRESDVIPWPALAPFPSPRDRRDVRLRWGAAPASADADDEPAHDVQQTQQDPRMVEQHGSHASLLRRGGWRPPHSTERVTQQPCRGSRGSRVLGIVRTSRERRRALTPWTCARTSAMIADPLLPEDSTLGFSGLRSRSGPPLRRCQAAEQSWLATWHPGREPFIPREPGLEARAVSVPVSEQPRKGPAVEDDVLAGDEPRPGAAQEAQAAPNPSGWPKRPAGTSARARSASSSGARPA